jgi:hypothetical protein
MIAQSDVKSGRIEKVLASAFSRDIIFNNAVSAEPKAKPDYELMTTHF